MAPRFVLLFLLLSLLPLVLPHPIRLPSAPCAARVAARSLEGRGAHRVLRTSLHVACPADVFRPRHPGGAHVACGEAPVTRTGSRGYNGNEGETEGGRTDGGEKERPTDGCRAVPELSSCTAASESVGSGGAAGRTRATIRLEQPVPRGLYADPFELERILRPEGDRAWVVGPVELEQPAPRCEATMALMERDVALGEGERKGEGEGAGGKVRKGEGDVHAGERKGEKGGVREGEDEVTYSVEFSLPLHSRYPAVLPTLSPPLSPLSLLRSASRSLLTLASLPWDLQQLQVALSGNHSTHSSLSTVSSLSWAITGSCSQSHAAVYVPLPSACLVLPPPPIGPGPSALHPSAPSSSAPESPPSASAPAVESSSPPSSAPKSPTSPSASPSCAEASLSAVCDAVTTPRCECLPMRLTWSSQPAAADGETDRSGGAARLGGDSEGDEAEERHEEVRREMAAEGALLWEVPGGCAAHTALVLWGTSLAAAVGALVLVAVAAAAPVHPGATKA